MPESITKQTKIEFLELYRSKLGEKNSLTIEMEIK